MVAVVATGLGVGVRLLLTPWLGDALPFLTIFPAVAVAVWYGGFWAGLLATMLGYLAAALFFIPPAGILLGGSEQIVGLIGFLLSCAIILIFGSRMHQARARAEDNARELAEQREWFRTTLASIGDAVITTDITGRVTFLNPIAERLTGWPAEEAEGEALARVFPVVAEPSGQPAVNPVDRVLREGSVVGLGNPTELIARDGARLPIDDSAAPIRDAEGRVRGIVLVFRDATDRRNREAEIRMGAARVRAFLETSLDGIITMDFQGNVLEFNPAAERLFGYSRHEAIGKSLADLIIPEPLRERHKQGLVRYLATGEGAILDRRVEMTALRADGSEVAVELSITRMLTPGMPVFSGHIRDIHDRVKADRRRAARLAVTQRLAESGSLEEAGVPILEAMGTGLGWDVGTLWLVDQERRVLCCETVWHREGMPGQGFERGSREFRFRIGEGLPGRTWASGRPEWIPDVSKDGNFPRAALAVAEGLRGAFAFPIRIGPRFFGIIEFFSWEVREPDPDLLEMVETLGNQLGQVMERRRIEMEAAAELREADRRKDEFLATLSHELRNPLAPLRNAVELLKRDPGRRGGQHALPIMERQLDQMVRLVDDLLEVSRITRRLPELRKAPVTLAAVVRNAIETSRPLIEERRHTLTVSLPEHPVWLDADLTRMAQVFSNLLNNAARYTEPSGRISLTALALDRQVVVTVRDTGMGIPAEQLSRVFDMFAQVDQSLHRSGGLGIGLTLARRLVELHGGTVTAMSDGPGKGSEFIVRIPMAAGPPPARPVVSSRAAAARARKILVVDDNEDATLTLGAVLQRMGHETRTALDGAAAVEAAAAFRPEIILLDIGLPTLNGYEVCQRIRSQPWGKEMAVIALTGWGQESDKVRAAAAGFTLHLVKPVDPSELERLLRDV